jgi:hypothetical protein
MKSMMRTKLVTIIVLSFFILVACSYITSPQGASTSNTNTVAPKILSQEQQDIVDLLASNKNEILLFDFKTQDEYKSVEFWVETYEYGVLTDRPSGANQVGDEARPLDGQVAVVISRDEELQWSFTMEYDGTKTSHTSIAAEIDESLACGSSPITTPVSIEDGKEIVLYSAVYSSGNIRTHDEQEYAEQPELLAEYPLAHLIKCKFES